MATPSDQHLLAFGRLIHNYASVETGIKIVLSGILQLRLELALVVFQPYAAHSVEKVAKSLAKERLKPELSDEFCKIVSDWFAFNKLRNAIAHSRWTEGKSPGSIKRRALSVQKGRVEWFGDEADETEYTAAELETAAHDLHLINERVKNFLNSSGLGKIVQSKVSGAN